MNTPLQTYTGLYAHVLMLSMRAIGRRGLYLLIAPLIGIPYGLITDRIAHVGGLNEGAGIAGGFLISLLRAAAISGVLYVGRAIVEQHRISLDDLMNGFSAFLWDVMTVFFALWIASLVLGSISTLLWLVVYLGVFAGLPTFEVVALSQASSFGIFEAAWRFVRRDAGPWLAGQLPLILLVVVYLGGSAAIGLATRGLPVSLGSLLDRFGTSALGLLLLLVAFVYRGILYLTLDNTSPRARAERFGGVPSLR